MGVTETVDKSFRRQETAPLVLAPDHFRLHSSGKGCRPKPGLPNIPELQ